MPREQPKGAGPSVGDDHSRPGLKPEQVDDPTETSAQQLTTQPIREKAGEVGGRRTDEKLKPDEPSQPHDLDRETLSGRDPVSVVTRLTAKLLPGLTPGDSDALLSAIATANDLEANRRGPFVEAVNHLLAGTGHSLEITVGRTRHSVPELTVENGSVKFKPVEGRTLILSHPAKLIQGETHAELKTASRDGGGIEQLTYPVERHGKSTQLEPSYMPRLRTLAHSIIDEPQSKRHIATLEQITKEAETAPPDTKVARDEFGRLVGLIRFATGDFADFGGVTDVAEQLGINLQTLQRAVADEIVQTFELSDGRKVVSLTECRVHWPHGARPPGRPRRKSV